VLFAGVGIITQMEDDDDWDESRIEQVIYRA